MAAARHRPRAFHQRSLASPFAVAGQSMKIAKRSSELLAHRPSQSLHDRLQAWPVLLCCLFQLLLLLSVKFVIILKQSFPSRVGADEDQDMTVDSDSHLGSSNSIPTIPLKKRDYAVMEASPEPPVVSATNSASAKASSGFMITDILSGRSPSPSAVVSAAAASEELRARFAAAAAVAAASRLGGNVADVFAASKAAAAAAGQNTDVSGDESEEAESVSGRDNYNDLTGLLSFSISKSNAFSSASLISYCPHKHSLNAIYRLLNKSSACKVSLFVGQ